MVIVDLHIILSTKSCIVTGELRFWGDVGENRKDKLVWELEDCESGIDQISVRSKELTRGLVLRLVWDAGDLRDSDNGTMVGRCFVTRPCANLLKNIEVFSR